MPGFKITQTIAALAVIAGFFLPWSQVNFGATVSKAVDLANKVVPGGVKNIGKLDRPEVAAGAAANVAAQGAALAKEAKALTIPTGSFSGLNISLSGKLMLLNFVVPAAALIVLLLAWLTPLGTGKIGTIMSTLALAALLGTLVLSATGGMMKDVATNVKEGVTAAPPSGMGEMLKELLKYLQWGFWVTAGGALLMLISSPFAKKRKA